MNPRPWLWLYRPQVPSVRAQSIQILQSAHAMASRGHEVTVLVEPTERPWSAEAALHFYGLTPIRTLTLRALPSSRTAASLAFRTFVGAWIARHGRRGVVYARRKRYAVELPPGPMLVLEAHEVDSLQEPEQGEAHRALERRVLARAQGVVTNCPGTLRLLREAHSDLPPAIACHNATHPSRARSPRDEGRGIGYVGSLRAYKDVETLARAARTLEESVTMVGTSASTPDAETLRQLSGGRLCFEPPLPHRDIPDRLVQFRTLVIPLSDTLFGRCVTSPLKLWDALAVGRPIVGADLPTLHDAAPGAFVPYRPGDADDLAHQLTRACEDEALREQVVSHAVTRTWAQRAREIEAFVESLR